MLSGRDCAYPPSDAELDAAWAAGVRVWGAYFAGLNVLFGWSDADILRVKARDFIVIAFCSGWADAATMGARARALGVLCCLDDESGMRPDGDWVEPWCATAGAGLYGNGSFHYNSSGIRAAAFHIFAGYYGYNPEATWPSFDTRPATPCGWQWRGSHAEFGGNVDSAWYDDTFAAHFGAVSGSLTGEVNDLLFYKEAEHGFLYVVGDSGKRYVWGFEGTDWTAKLGAPVTKSAADLALIPNAPTFGSSQSLPPATQADVKAATADVKTAIAAIPAASGGGSVDLTALTAAVSGVQATAQGTAADVTAIRMRIEKDLAS